MNEGIDGVHDSDEDEIEMGKARSPDCGGGLLPCDVISYAAHRSTNLAVAPIFCESHFFFFLIFCDSHIDKAICCASDFTILVWFLLLVSAHYFFFFFFEQMLHTVIERGSL